MTKINVFDIRRSHIFYKNEMGDVVIKPNTPYFYAKLIKFDGDRISNVIEPGFPHPDDFDFISEDKITVQETFNEMIFNITIGDESITTRPTTADNIVKNMYNRKNMEKIFTKYSEGTTNVALLESVLKTHGERVVTNERGWIIDDLFMVDRKSMAFNWDSKLKDINKKQHTNLSSHVICIVVNKNHGITDAPKIDTAGGPVQIDPVGYQIISKINFLLNPNLKDTEFTSQVPKSTMEILQRQDPVQPKGSGIFFQHRLDEL